MLAQDPTWAPWPAPVVLDTVDSTMTRLREHAGEGAPQGAAVVADEQTAGRGRHGRTWQSPPGTGVWASVLLRPGATEPGTLGVLPLLIGAAIAGELSRWSGARLQVKWPNDIVWLREGEGASAVAKLAGVLAERLPDGAIVIGVGLNVLAAPPDTAAIALADIVDDAHRAGLSREDAAVEVLRAVAQAASAWLCGEHDLTDYRRRCITVGRRVSVTAVAGAQSWSGQAVGVDDTGLLLVEDAAGARIAVAAGDVTLAE